MGGRCAASFVKTSANLLCQQTPHHTTQHHTTGKGDGVKPSANNFIHFHVGIQIWIHVCV